MKQQPLRNYLQFTQNTLVRVTGRNPLAFTVNGCEDIHQFRQRLLDLQFDFAAAARPLLDPGREDPAALRCLRLQLQALKPFFRFDEEGRPSRPAIAVEERGKKDGGPRRSPPPGARPLRRRPVGVHRLPPLPPRAGRPRRRLPLPLRRSARRAPPVRPRLHPMRQNRPNGPARPPQRLLPPPPRPLPPSRPRQPLRRPRQSPLSRQPRPPHRVAPRRLPPPPPRHPPLIPPHSPTLRTHKRPARPLQPTPPTRHPAKPHKPNPPKNLIP